MPMVGNSISGPITKASAIKGFSGKALTAIAKARGELRAKAANEKPIEADFSILAIRQTFTLKNKLKR